MFVSPINSKPPDAAETRPGPKPDVSLSIVNYNSSEYLLRCLKTVKENSAGLNVQILIVDNASENFGPEEVYQLFPDAVITINKKNQGFARAQNQNFGRATSDCFLLLNPDTLITQDSLHAILDCFRRFRDVAVVGPNLFSPEGKRLVNVKTFPTLGAAFKELLFLTKDIDRQHPESHAHEMPTYQRMDCITGAVFAVRREIYQSLGGLDEGFFMYFEEVDFCRRLRDTFQKEIVLLPHVKVLHFLGRSSIQNDVRQTVYYESYYRYFRKHHGLMKSLVLRFLICLSSLIKIAGIQVKYFPTYRGWKLYLHKMGVSFQLLSWALGIKATFKDDLYR